MKLLISKNKIREAVKKLGATISDDYRGKELVLVGLLKGSFVFQADLIRELKIENLYVDFMETSSYIGKTSSGEVKIFKDLEGVIHNKHVLIIDDIVDTGQTLSKIIDLLNGRKPASLEVCTLLDKPSKRLVDVKVKYIGIAIDDKFVVGYGLDIDQKLRNLPDIMELIK